MRIAEFLREDLIVPDLSATDKAGALGELCAALARASPGLSAPKLAEALLERGKLGPTGIGEGVAHPPGKLPRIPGPPAAFGRKKAGVGFSSTNANATPLF